MSRDRRWVRQLYWALTLAMSIVAAPVQAKYWGADPPSRCCTCACEAQGGPTGKCSSYEQCSPGSISRTKGNLRETYSGVSLKSASGAPPQLKFTYNSYNADTSRARIDTVLGNGWTHSYNVFLYSVRGDMFRIDGDGRITRYKLGTGGKFTAATGYFETLVRNPDGSFTLAKKDQTTYQFAAIPGTPFLSGTPVYQLT